MGIKMSEQANDASNVSEVQQRTSLGIPEGLMRSQVHGDQVLATVATVAESADPIGRRLRQKLEKISALAESGSRQEVSSLVNELLTLEAFGALSGRLAGVPFVKVIVEIETGQIHFLNNARYSFHAEYIADKLLKVSHEELYARIDEYNQSFYLVEDRKYCLGIVALHEADRGGVSRSDISKRFFTLETVEIDNMGAEMLRGFFDRVSSALDPSLPLLFKPANHIQEAIVAAVSPAELPRILNHELFASASYIALNPGKTFGRLRAFDTEDEYQKARSSLEWYDIICMQRVPDDVPRVSGLVNSEHTTPLSHTNVLASGWGIPNAIQVGILDQIREKGMNGRWVRYEVESNHNQVVLVEENRPVEIPRRPNWTVQRVNLEAPEVNHVPVKSLIELRKSDRYRYGTKAANLGEVMHILQQGSERLLGFYRVKRPPRENLLGFAARMLGKAEQTDLGACASQFLRNFIEIPRGIALPFSLQQEFLETSAPIQQQIGRLKMALELEAREIDPICLRLQQMIRATRMSDRLRDLIDTQIALHLSGVTEFVVRSSSNAEDLDNFSAAGIYESKTHVTSAEKIFDAVKEVWASLCSPRSVRLRSEVGISLDEAYMGVIIQEQVPSSIGGVMVTTNPMKKEDFRNVYINVSTTSVERVVEGVELSMQYHYNTVEGGGQTLSLGSAQNDLSKTEKESLQKLAFAGRLLQSHFSPDYTFSQPIDVEWAMGEERVQLLQLRPYRR